MRRGNWTAETVMRKRWWQYLLLLLVVALVVAWVATRHDRGDFPYAFAHIVILLLGIGVVMPLTASQVASWHQRITKRPHATAGTILGFLVGCLVTAPLVIALGFRALESIRKHWL